MTRIAIVDPHPAVRAGLTALLRAEPGLVPVGSAGTVEEALELVARAAPDLVLLEPYLGVDDGLQLCRRITGDGGPRVVAYTEVGDPALEVALRVACADGIVDKQATPEELFEALRTSPAAAPRSRRSRPASCAPPRRGSRATTSRCSRCSSTAPRRPTWPTRCGSTAAAMARRVERLLGAAAPAHEHPRRGLSVPAR